MKRKLIIAIDGPAGSGKSTTARMLAARMKLPYIDTGAMYRAVTLKAMRKDVSLKNVQALAALARGMRIRFGPVRGVSQKVYLDGKEVTKAIREPKLTENVQFVAREPRIRRELVKKQRALGKKDGAVMEGRDIGTVVFPKADYKFYFDASDEVRARRRYRELVAAGKKTSLKKVLSDLTARDYSDTNRSAGALKTAKDARVLDTTGLTIPQTVDKILRIIGNGR